MVQTSLNYKKLSNSQVLLHPNPKGIIQFIGSFIYGSFPAWAYKYLHQFLFDQGYSIVLYRFPLNPTQFNHWDVSLELLREQHALRIETLKLLKQENQSIDVLKIYSNPASYRWLGHSLGCKYIILLEILSQNPVKRAEILKECLSEETAAKVIQSLDLIARSQQQAEVVTSQLLPETESSHQFVIRDQSSVLLAPEISSTVRFLKSGWRISNNRANPTQKQTESLIQASKDIFNLMGVISFNWDSIAEDDVVFMKEQICYRHFQPYLYQELEGYHLEPLSTYIENLGRCIVDFFDELQCRQSSKLAFTTSSI